MKFKWNQERERLETDHPDIFVLVIRPYIDVRGSEFVLCLKGRRFAFEAMRTLSNDQRTANWEICDICQNISRGVGERRTEYAHIIRFENRHDQTLVMEIIESALGGYFGNPNPNIDVISTVTYAEQITERLSNGYYIQ